MKATNAWQQALKQAKGRYADLLAGSLILIAVRLIALCPLMGLLAPRTSPLRYLAVLTPFAIVLGIFPLRASMAEAMADFMAGGKFCTKKLVSFARYGEKMKNALSHALLVLLWALPLIAALGSLVFAFMGGGEVDAFTALRFVGGIGALIGGSFMEGILLLVLGVILLALPMCYGLCRLSSCRHLWAIGAPMSAMNGARLRQVGLGVVNALLLIPLFALIAWVGKDIVKVFLDTFSLPSMIQYVYIIVIGVAVLYLPLLPLRKLSVACFSKLQADKTHAA